ncbi:hypothetical protein HY498_01645 [Candidatus Woesearchaeota archaeon]|nr:hypothetical protein [Candidatus Woesearchaeota archaeon]
MSHEEERMGCFCFLLGGAIGSVVGGVAVWYFSSFGGSKFGEYTLKTEHGKVKVENILRIDGEPKYQINLKEGGIESLIEIRGFNLERHGDDFEAKALGDEYELRKIRTMEKYSGND